MPEWGRFLNRDPLEEEGGENLYRFLSNDPVNRWDLLGLSDGTDQENENTDTSESQDSAKPEGTLDPNPQGDSEPKADQTPSADTNNDKPNLTPEPEPEPEPEQESDPEPESEDAGMSWMQRLLLLLAIFGSSEPQNPDIKPVKPPTHHREEVVDKNRRKSPPSGNKEQRSPTRKSPQNPKPTTNPPKSTRIPWWQRIPIPTPLLIPMPMGDFNGNGMPDRFEDPSNMNPRDNMS